MILKLETFIKKEETGRKPGKKSKEMKKCLLENTVLVWNAIRIQINIVIF